MPLRADNSYADVWDKREPWEQPLAWSVALHAFFFGGILLYAALLGAFHGEDWGGAGGGGAIGVQLVSNVPLPRPNVNTENILANDSKGLTKTEPAKAPPEPKDAIPIPDKPTKARPTPRVRETPQVAKNEPPPQPTNVVQYGQGGPISAGMYGMFNAAGAKGGFGFSGTGGGDFGSRYAWYVKVVRDKVSENWMKYEVDPNIHDARRVYVTFDITRDGRPTNIQIEKSSDVPSLDQSAVRALQRIDSFGPLPNDYAGNRVSVEFWFDYRR